MTLAAVVFLRSRKRPMRIGLRNMFRKNYLRDFSVKAGGGFFAGTSFIKKITFITFNSLAGFHSKLLKGSPGTETYNSAKHANTAIQLTISPLVDILRKAKYLQYTSGSRWPVPLLSPLLSDTCTQERTFSIFMKLLLILFPTAWEWSHRWADTTLRY